MAEFDPIQLHLLSFINFLRPGNTNGHGFESKNKVIAISALFILRILNSNLSIKEPDYVPLFLYLHDSIFNLHEGLF